MYDIFDMGHDNYTKVPNKVLAALVKTPLPAYEFRIFLALLRASLGWHRSYCIKSYPEIAAFTGIDYRNVRRAVRGLERKLMLAAHRTREATCFELNLQPSTWRIEYKEPCLFTNNPDDIEAGEPMSLETHPETQEPVSLETQEGVSALLSHKDKEIYRKLKERRI